MKTILSILLLAMTFITGCASYSVTSVGGRTTVDVQNSGWYLLSFAPIASGDPDEPNEVGCRFFEDSVKLANNMKMLKQAMAAYGASDTDNVVTYSTNEKILFILLKRYTMHTSAELVK